jgi:alanine dehydrogenase
VAGADVVLCCTGATTPVVERDWLEPGAHISSVGGSHGHEVDAATVAEAEVYVEWLGAVTEPPPAGAHELQDLDPGRVRLLGDVLAGADRPSRTGLTLFKSTGHAALDVAAAAVAHRRARAHGLGRTLVF